MTKGQARISLHGQRDVLIKLLRECKTLGDIAVILGDNGIRVSVSSLHRYMLSDMADEYKEYLWITGRGLLKSRLTQFRDSGELTKKVAVGRESHGVKISNQKDLNKFISNNR